MNPYLIAAACFVQVAILAARAPWLEGITASAVICGVVAGLAFTRLKWGAHLDMYLAMMAYGGLGMMLPGLVTGRVCHHGFDWGHYAWMSAGMWAFSLPPIWREARCVAAARREGRGLWVLLLDGIGMQLGMGLAHLPLLWLPMGDLRVEWLSQASMLVGMGLGMMAAQWWSGEWNRQDVAAMG